MKKQLLFIPLLAISCLTFLTGCKKQCKVVIFNNNPEMGNVSGGGTYPKGTVITLVADPKDYYEFVSWEAGATKSAREKFQYTVTDSVTIYANFKKINFDINIINHPRDIFGKLIGETSYGWCERTNLKISNYSGYKIHSWNDNSSILPLSTTNELAIDMPKKDLDINITFDENLYTLGQYPQTKVTDSNLKSSLKYLYPEDNSYLQYEGISYYHTSDNTFFKVEPIVWDIVTENFNTITLISKNSLFGYKFQDTNFESYSTSDFRQYLQNEFYNNAFTQDEKNIILGAEHLVENDKTITDKVFIPFENHSEEFWDDQYRVDYKYSLPSDYATANGVVTKQDTDQYYYLTYCAYYVACRFLDDNSTSWHYIARGCRGDLNEKNVVGVRPMIVISK